MSIGFKIFIPLASTVASGEEAQEITLNQIYTGSVSPEVGIDIDAAQFEESTQNLVSTDYYGSANETFAPFIGLSIDAVYLAVYIYATGTQPLVAGDRIEFTELSITTDSTPKTLALVSGTTASCIIEAFGGIATMGHATSGNIMVTLSDSPPSGYSHKVQGITPTKVQGITPIKVQGI